MNWISVKDRLPEHAVYVCVWVEYPDGDRPAHGDSAWLSKIDEDDQGFWYMERGTGVVTHWCEFVPPSR